MRGVVPSRAAACSTFSRSTGRLPWRRPQGSGPDDQEAPVRLAPSYRCPVLGLFGGADQAIPAEAIERFRRELDQAGVDNEMVVYEGAPHSFFDRAFEQHREACDDAWRRMLRFVGASAA